MQGDGGDQKEQGGGRVQIKGLGGQMTGVGCVCRNQDRQIGMRKGPGDTVTGEVQSRRGMTHMG